MGGEVKEGGGTSVYNHTGLVGGGVAELGRI